LDRWGLVARAFSYHPVIPKRSTVCFAQGTFFPPI
jgi:hypothetical protein